MATAEEKAEWARAGQMQSRQENRSLFQKLINPFPKAQGFVVPFSAGASGASAIKTGAGGIKAVVGGTKNFFRNLPNLIKSKTLSPAAGKAPKEILPTLGKFALGGAVTGGGIMLASEVSKMGVTGQPPNIMDVIQSVKKGALVGTGFGISPLGGLGGALQGTGILTGQAAKNRIQKLLGIGENYGQSRIEDLKKNINDTMSNLPTNNLLPQQPMIFNVTAPEAQAPQFVMPSSPSFAPALSVSGSAGGFGENLPLLLMLLAGGAGLAGLGGYAIGKRKKKRYKKKRKHK